MKIKFLFALLLLGVLLYSCHKEKSASSNYTLTNDDLKYLPYEVGDTIKFWATKYTNGDTLQEVDYIVTAKGDSSYTDGQNNRYSIKYFDFDNNYYFGGRIMLIKTQTGINFKIHYLDPHREPPLADAIEGMLGFYSLQTLNGINYSNVYKIGVEDTSADPCFFVKIAWIAKEKGIVRIEKHCVIMDMKK